MSWNLHQHLGLNYFSLLDVPAIIALTTGQSASFSVKYAPTEEGDHTGTVSITYDGRATKTIRLDGECYETVILPLPWSEDFSDVSSGQIPEGWERTYENWYVDPDFEEAGGDAPELLLVSDPEIEGQIRAITPPLLGNSLNGYSLSFKHMIDHYERGNPYTLKVESSRNLSNWTTIWSVEPSESVNSVEVIVDADFKNYLGEPFWLAWTLDGNTGDIKKWYIDDIKLEAIPYDFPEGVEQTIEVGEGENATTIYVTVDEGNANQVPDGTVPPVPNDDYEESFNLVLRFFSPTWKVTFKTEAPWGAFYRNGQWHAKPGQDGEIEFSSDDAKQVRGDYEDIPFTFGDEDPSLPVELSGFHVNLNNKNQVVISWASQSETNLLGYQIYRHNEEDLEQALCISELIEATNTSQQQIYLYTDKDLLNAETYYYWLQSIDLDGTMEYYGPIYVILPDTPDSVPPIPLRNMLFAAYPNPFNPSTSLRYSLKDAGEVMIQIYNLKGQIVKTFRREHSVPGNYYVIWDGTNDLGKLQSNGVYFYRMTSEKYKATKKMVLSK